ADAVHPADVGMRYLSRDPDFVPKSSQGSLAHMRACEKLERHLLAEDQIMRTIHFAHAAFADEAHHTIAAGESRTGWKAGSSISGGDRCGCSGKRGFGLGSGRSQSGLAGGADSPVLADLA